MYGTQCIDIISNIVFIQMFFTLFSNRMISFFTLQCELFTSCNVSNNASVCTNRGRGRRRGSSKCGQVWTGGRGSQKVPNLCRHPLWMTPNVHACCIWLIFPFHHNLFLFFMFPYLSLFNYFRHIMFYKCVSFSTFVRDIPFNNFFWYFKYQRWLISNCIDIFILCNTNKTGVIFKTHISSNFPLHEISHNKESIILKRYAWKTLCSSKELLVTHGRNYYLLRKICHTMQNIMSSLLNEIKWNCLISEVCERRKNIQKKI